MARGRLGILLSIVALACAGAPVGAADLPPGDAVRALGNPGFEAPASDPAAPPGWGSLGSAYGTARVVQRGGRSVLELAPSAKGSTGSTSFMVYQVLDAAHFRGKKVTFGANVASAGAGINLVLWSPEGATNDFDPNVQQAAFAERRKVATVPADASTLTLGVQVLGPAGGKAWVDDVFVALEGEATAFFKQMVDQLEEEEQKLFARFVEIEAGHEAIVQAEIDALTGLGFWFDYTEFRLEGA